MRENGQPTLTAEVLGVRPAFLRSLDAAGVVRPARSARERRRYSRRQLAVAARIRELLDQGHPLPAARRILDLEDARQRAAMIQVIRRRRHEDEGG